MKGIRKFVGFAAIAAVLNPLCCCIAEVVAMPGPAKDPVHACCTQQQADTAPEKAPDNGCSSDEGCPHKQGAYERELPVDTHGFAVSLTAPLATREHSEVLIAAAAASPIWERGEQKPPGRHDPPAYLRSHSFLN